MHTLRVRLVEGHIVRISPPGGDAGEVRVPASGRRISPPGLLAGGRLEDIGWKEEEGSGQDACQDEITRLKELGHGGLAVTVRG